jgi:hypothetical protein
MAYVTTKIDKTTIKESTGGGSYISGSGIYDVSIERASKSKTKNGATSIDISLINDAGNSTIFYNNITETAEGKSVDKNGKPLMGVALINKILIISNLEGYDDEPDIQTVTVKVGKENKKITLGVLTDFDDLPLKAQVQEEYSRYNNNISRKLVIKSVFRTEDGASAEEIVADAEGEEINFGKQLAIITERYADKITYKNELTAEEVTAWKESQNSSSNTSTKTPKAKTNKAAGSLFKK